MTYAYDVNGNLTQVTNQVGLATKILSVDAGGRPTSIQGPDGVITNLTYDPRDRLTSITVNPGTAQAQTGITYDPSGDVTQIVKPDGSVLQYAYDPARRLTSVINNTGENITYTYNANSQVATSVTASSGGTITKQMSMAYDEIGRLLQSIGASSQTTTYAYDRTDLNTQVQDPRSNLYGFAYDSLSRLVQTTNQESAKVNLTLDGQDNVTAYQDPRAITTSYVRNGFGEVIEEVSPDAGTSTFVRDLHGSVTQVTDGRGVVINKTYDKASRLLTETYPADTTENVTYAHDSVAGSTYGKGRLTSITDQSGKTTYTYNALGQIVTDKRVIAGKTYTTSYAYDAAGHVTQMTYPSGRIVTYARNANGQVVNVTSQQNATYAAINIATDVTYAPMSNLVTGLTHGNGLVTSAGYDRDYRLTSLQVMNGASTVSSLAYAYGDGLNLTGITDGLTPANSNVLSYTPANRLASATGPWGTESFSYDAVGNRLNDNVVSGASSTTTLASYPVTSNQLSALNQNAATLRSYAYDAGGNIITDTRPGQVYQFGYNNRNRMSTVMLNGSAYATYGYNALEEMTTRTTSATGGPVGQVAYIYDQGGHLIAEAKASTGATTRDYIWQADNDNTPTDMPLAVSDVSGTTATISYVHTDHLGRPIRMTDASGATVFQALYKPYGEVYSTSATKALNLRFPGQYFQIETGFATNWHRHYDPVTGRYTQPDPLRFVDGPSVYNYATASPLMKIDRTGLSFGRSGSSASSSSAGDNGSTCHANDNDNQKIAMGPIGRCIFYALCLFNFSQEPGEKHPHWDPQEVPEETAPSPDPSKKIKILVP